MIPTSRRNQSIALPAKIWIQCPEKGCLAVARPAGVEGWLPIEGLMQLRYFIGSGQVPRLHPAGFFLFGAFVLMSWLFRTSFCSWLCPVGTVSDYLGNLGRFVFGQVYFQLVPPAGKQQHPVR